jgi:disulfide bond formation protein DsbB
VGLGDIALLIVAVFTLALLVFYKKNKFLAFIKENYVLLGFLIALAATITSLVYSEIIGYAPCKLCWLQRIAIYPMTILFLLAYRKKDKHVAYYVFPITVLGTLVALYHNFIYYFGEGSAPCDSSGVSCVQRLVSEFGGFASIPSLSLMGFLAILTLLAVNYFYNKE